MNDKVIGSIILEGANTMEDTVIVDGGKNNHRVIAEGTLQDMDVENRNRRIYAAKDLTPEINGPRMRELIKAKQFYGECGHPLSDDLIRQQTIDPKLVAINYLKVWTEGNLVKARYKGTNNDYGETLDRDLREGASIATSLRALGSIENVSGKAYVKNIKIITWDYVIYPSHKVAYTDKIVSESAIDGTPIFENQVTVPEDDPGTIYTLRESDAKTIINRLQKESANLTTIVETFEGLYDEIKLINPHTVQMRSRYGEKININLEQHVDSLIMDFAFKN